LVYFRLLIDIGRHTGRFQVAFLLPNYFPAASSFERRWFQCCFYS